MKRTRREAMGEDEEEEHQEQQAAPTPMAVSPVRNHIPRSVPATPPPPSGAGTGTSHGRVVVTSQGRVLTWDDALDFVLNVRQALDQAKYREFLGIFSRINRIGAIGVVYRMMVLLRGHPDLKRQFNLFLPAHLQLRLDDNGDQ